MRSDAEIDADLAEVSWVLREVAGLADAGIYTRLMRDVPALRAKLREQDAQLDRLRDASTVVTGLDGLLSAAEAKLAAVQDLIDHAHKVSPSEAMIVYVADLELAIGHDVAARPRRTGQNEGTVG